MERLNTSVDVDQALWREDIQGSIAHARGLARAQVISTEEAPNGPTDGWVPYPVTQRWFPHAFIGTMGSVLEAIATGTEPRSSVRDNVKTIELVAAIYRSIESNEVVRFD